MTPKALENAVREAVAAAKENADESVSKATLEYLNRKYRISHPDGDFDAGGRFYLSDEERRRCCAGIRVPSRSYPWSEMTHGRTLRHVAALYNVEEREVRRLCKSAERLLG